MQDLPTEAERLVGTSVDGPASLGSPQENSEPEVRPLESPTKYDTRDFLRERPAKRIDSWRAIGAGSVVQGWLNGVRVSEYLMKVPAPFHLPAIPVKACDKPWLGKELDRCVVTGAMEPATDTTYVSNAFVHTQPNGKRRLVINFKHLNTFMRKVAQKYETLKVLRNLAQEGDWAISFDLQDGFHAIPIAEEDRKYLTFEIDGKIWQCAALPFGWTLSPWIFCKVMRVVVRFFRSHAGPHLDVRRPPPRKPWDPGKYPTVKSPGTYAAYRT